MKPNPPAVASQTPAPTRPSPAASPCAPALCCRVLRGPSTSAREPFALKMKVWLLLGLLLVHEALGEGE